MLRIRQNIKRKEPFAITVTSTGISKRMGKSLKRWGKATGGGSNKIGKGLRNRWRKNKEEQVGKKYGVTGEGKARSTEERRESHGGGKKRWVKGTEKGRTGEGKVRKREQVRESTEERRTGEGKHGRRKNRRQKGTAEGRTGEGKARKREEQVRERHGGGKKRWGKGTVKGWTRTMEEMAWWMDEKGKKSKAKGWRREKEKHCEGMNKRRKGTVKGWTREGKALWRDEQGRKRHGEGMNKGRKGTVEWETG